MSAAAQPGSGAVAEQTLAAAPALAALQGAFQQFLMSGQANGDKVFAAAVAPGGRIPTERRLAIYHNAYRARMTDALRDSYGHTASYLGHEGFEALAHDYLADHPSTHPSLRWFGRAFAGWLHDKHPGDPDVAELARLDWALRAAFDGPDAEPLAAAVLGEIPADAWACLRFVWHPTCQRLRLHHNTLAIWQSLDQDEAPPSTSLLSMPTELLVWRMTLQPHFRSLDPVEACALDLMQAGQSFATACQALSEAFPDLDVAPTAGRLLRRWLDEGLLIGWTDPAAADDTA